MYFISEKDAIHGCIEKNEIKGDMSKYKDSETDFKVICYDPDLNVTIVKCYPKTGRTHQIRVHLKSIGHPIENDKIYRTIFEVEKNIEYWKKQEKLVLNDVNFTINEKNQVIPNIPGEEFEEIYLHAYKYKFGAYKFKTKFPEWTKLPNPIFIKSSKKPLDAKIAEIKK